jgi:hypothetical protein
MSLSRQNAATHVTHREFAKGKFMRIGLYNSVLVALSVALGGCTTPPYCESMGKCGGDYLANAKDLGLKSKSQEWVATATDACVDQVPNPPNPASLLLIPPRPAGQRAVEPATVDWCNNLVLSADGTIKDFDDGWYETLKQFSGWFPSVPLYTAQIEFEQNYQYTVTTTQLVSQHTDFSNACLIAQGVVLSCEHINNQLQQFVEKKLNTVPGLQATVYHNTCSQTSEAGCSCDYDVSLTSSSAGPWTAASGKISFFDFDAAPPSQADYCVNANGMSLSGTKGTDLFNRNSLKTLALRPPTCSDGVMSKTLGEEGIDCGGQCQKACK